mgnify:CR=1 FL=1
MAEEQKSKIEEALTMAALIYALIMAILFILAYIFDVIRLLFNMTDTEEERKQLKLRVFLETILIIACVIGYFVMKGHGL